MSIITTRMWGSHKANIEIYDSVMDVVNDCKSRKITSKDFDDMQKEALRKGWHGVDTYDEALRLMRDGWTDKVEALQAEVNKSKTIDTKRIAFKNDIQGFAPIVPLAILGIPNAMINTAVKPIKSKVISIYYNSSISSKNDSDTLVKNGKKVIEAVIKLEKDGYRVNLNVVQTYAESSSSDVLVVKVKSANQPLDLKRVCFPIMHAAMFRVIGFDWYSKFPKGKHRCGYGCPLKNALGSDEKAREFMRAMFGKEAVYLIATEIQGKSSDDVAEMLKGGKMTNEN